MCVFTGEVRRGFCFGYSDELCESQEYVGLKEQNALITNVIGNKGRDTTGTNRKDRASQKVQGPRLRCDAR